MTWVLCKDDAQRPTLVDLNKVTWASPAEADVKKTYVHFVDGSGFRINVPFDQLCKALRPTWRTDEVEEAPK